MTQSITGRTDGAGLRIGIVAALWNDFITGKLLEGALETLQLHGVHEDDVTVVRCPGSFEIPIVASTMAESGCYDAIVTLGVIIKGDTAHFEYVSGPVADSIARISVDTGIPCVFGVLTTYTIEQAQERAGGGMGNKGAEAAVVALQMASILTQLDEAHARQES